MSEYKDALPMSTYRASTGITRGDILAACRTAAHFKAGQEAPEKESSEIQIIGSAVHCSVLEPDLFDTSYAVGPINHKGLKEWKAWAKELDEADAPVPKANRLKPNQAEAVLGMTKAVRTHPKLTGIFDPGRCFFERSLYWEDEETGLLCKGRPDIIYARSGVILDVKTTKDAGERAFERTLADGDLHVQAAHYLAGARACLGGEWKRFGFIVVETEPSYEVALYNLDEVALAAGEMVRRHGLGVIKAALDCGKFDGYPEKFVEIGLPPWKV